MAQITYTNKVALNENPEIADINKVTDDDMNEIKQVVNDNYNNTIQITNTEPTDSDNKIWIDTGEIAQQVSEITNSYSTSTGLGYSANYVNNLHTYSTDEVRIGTWIDGKPLYRKVIESTNISSDMQLYISDLDLIINVYGTAIRNPGSYYNLPRLNKSNINGQIGFYYTDNELHVEIGTGVTNVTKIIVVVEYTKTTD